MALDFVPEAPQDSIVNNTQVSGVHLKMWSWKKVLVVDSRFTVL